MVFHNNFNVHSATVKLNSSKLILERESYAQLISGCHYSLQLGPQCLEAAESPNHEQLFLEKQKSVQLPHSRECEGNPHPDISYLEGKF